MDTVVGHPNLPPCSWSGGAVTVGVFDGVHRGHREVLRRTLERSDELGAPAVVVTFDRHPLQTLTGKPPELIVPLAYRLELLARLGVPRCLVLEFDHQLAMLPAERFVQEILIGRIGARAAVLGYDCRFGRGGEGDGAYIAVHRERLGIDGETVGPVDVNGAQVSSSMIREAIRRGELDRAAALLGHPVTLHGPIVRGAARGRTLGFPTANIDPAGFLLPPHGVYLARGTLGAHTYDALVNIGTRPTFETAPLVLVEAHLRGLDREAYDEPLTLQLVRRLRDVMRFDGPEELAAQIRRDLRALPDLPG